MAKSKFLSGLDTPLLLVLFLAFILRLFVMLNSQGSFHADEIFQTVEPAHRLAFGYGIKTWEWEKGIRSWFLPGAYAGILFIGKIAGIHFFNLILSLFGIYAVFVIGKESGGKKAGIIVGLLAAASIFLIKFAHRPLTEAVSMNFILLALASAYKGVREDRGYLLTLSGALLGASFLIRFPSALFIIPTAIFVTIYRPKLFLWFAVPLCSILILGGFLDLATWGSFWHAPIEFLKFNILENKSAIFGITPATWYLKLLFPNKLVTVLTVIFFAIGAYRNGFVSSSFLAYLLVFSLIPHKEERFIIPIIPLSLITLGLGIERVTNALFKRTYVRNLAIIFLIAIYSLYPSFKLKKGDVVPYNNKMFLCMNFVGVAPDVKALLYLDWWHSSGGYSYLRRKIPILFCDPDTYTPQRLEDLLSRNEFSLDYRPDLSEAGPYSTISVDSINYAIARDSRYDEVLIKHGFVKIREFGAARVYRRVTCLDF